MNHPLRLMLALVGVLHFLAPLLPGLGVGQSMAIRATDEGIPPELPPGIFFSIWGVIFVAYLAFAILANIRPRAVSDQLAGPLGQAGAGNVIWMVSAQTIGSVWLDFLLLLPILFFIWQAAYRLDRIGGFDGTGRRLLVCLLVGLMSGWLAVAVSISVPDVVREALGRGVSDAPWQSLWLVLITASGLAWLFASRVSTSLWFFVALGWGLTGVFINNWYRTQLHWLAIVTVVVGAYVVWRRLRYGASGSMQWNG